MNLLEALKSGKPFYRKNWTRRPITHKEIGQLTKEEMLADDWLVDSKEIEKQVTITSLDFDWAVVSLDFDGKTEVPSEEYLLKLKRKLGL